MSAHSNPLGNRGHETAGGIVNCLSDHSRVVGLSVLLQPPYRTLHFHQLYHRHSDKLYERRGHGGGGGSNNNSDGHPLKPELRVSTIFWDVVHQQCHD
jgi:hypothetical protein